MKQSELFYCLVFTLLLLGGSGCGSVSQGKTRVPIEPAPAPTQTQAQMAAGIRAATETLEATLLMGFVRSPNQEFFEKATGAIGRALGEMPTLVPMTAMCPAGTTHICSRCESMRPIFACPLLPGTKAVTGSGRQSPELMLAGIQASMSLLDAELQARFVHTPDQRFFDGVMRILSRSFQEFPELSSEGQGGGCPEGTVDLSRKCVASGVFEALRTRRFP